MNEATGENVHRLPQFTFLDFWLYVCVLLRIDEEVCGPYHPGCCSEGG